MLPLCGVCPSGETEGRRAALTGAGSSSGAPGSVWVGGMGWGQASNIPEILRGTRGPQPTFLLQNQKQMWAPLGGVEQEPGQALGTLNMESETSSGGGHSEAQPPRTDFI